MLYHWILGVFVFTCVHMVDAQNGKFDIYTNIVNIDDEKCEFVSLIRLKFNLNYVWQNHTFQTNLLKMSKT